LKSGASIEGFLHGASPQHEKALYLREIEWLIVQVRWNLLSMLDEPAAQAPVGMIAMRKAVRWARGPAMVVMTAALLAACAAPQAEMPARSGGAILGASPAVAAVPTRIPRLGELTGMQPPQIVAMFGQPDLKRDDPPAEVWQYRAADCVLNLFFYEDQQVYRLTHAETWDRSAAAGLAPARCRDEDAPLKAHLVRQSAL
jgi:hypothetical protein